MDFSAYRLEELKTIYSNALEEIKDAVLAGVAWENLLEQRLAVGLLSFEIQKKSPFDDFGDPVNISL